MATWSPSNVLITKQGDELLANIQAGLIDSLEITEVKVGSGRESTSALYTMGNLTFARQNAEIISKKASHTGSTLELQVSNKELTEAYNITQIGVFAKYNDTTILYMIAQCDEGTEDYMPLPTLTPTTMSYSFNVIQGSATELIVQVNPAGFVTYEQFAQTEEIVKSGVEIRPEYREVVEEDLNDESNFSLNSGEALPTLVRKLAVIARKVLSHSKDKVNPHSVTAKQVGLEKVPNVTTNEQKPTYTQASTLTNLVSGENLSTSMGKVMKAISEIISHLANRENPHSVTAKQVGLGNVPNVSTNDQTPTYTESDSLTNLLSGEKLSVALGKMSKAVKDLISHISNRSNPHEVSASQIGASPLSHSHIISDIDGLLDSLNNKAIVGHLHGMTDIAELVGTLNEIRTSISRKSPTGHTHSISAISGLKSALDGKAPSSHNHSSSDITSGTLPISRGGTGATSASAALSELGAQPSLGFIPIQQGGGTGQKDNKIYIGWTDSNLKAQVDNLDLGNIVTDGTSNAVVLPISKGGTGAKTAANAESSIMPVTTITAASTFGSKRDSVSSVSSCYVKKIGKRINGTLILSRVTSGSNCKSQVFTISSSYRPSGNHIGIVNVMTYDSKQYSRGMGFINVSGKDGIITLVLPAPNVTYQTVEIFFDYYTG